MKIRNVALAINKYILVEVLKTKIEILIKQKNSFWLTLYRNKTTNKWQKHIKKKKKKVNLKYEYIQ